MLTINLLNILVWFMGCCTMWKILPKQYTEELGAVVCVGLNVLWTAFCIIFFGILHHKIIIQ